MDLSVIKFELSSRQESRFRHQAENDLLQRQITELDVDMEQQAKQLSICEQASEFVQDVANSRRGIMKSRIEEVVTEALRIIYGPSYGVLLTYSVKAHRSFLDIELTRDTSVGEVRRTMDGFGGGVSDTISIPLRLLVLLASHQADRVCVVDECYKHLDPERIPQAALFIREIAEQLGVQVIMLSHWKPMKEEAERVYVIQERDGCSFVTVEV